MTRTPRQKAYRRVNREHSQFNDIALSAKAGLLLIGLDYYQTNKIERFEEQDYENVAIMRRIVEDLSKAVMSIDFSGWIDNIRGYNENRATD